MRSVLSRRARPGPLAVALAATTLAAGALVPLAGTAHAAVACSVTYTTNQWPGGFTANVTLRNEGDALSGWRLTWTFLDGQRIQQAWSSRYTQSGSAVTVTNEAWNGNVAAGGSVSFGFNASWTGQNRPPTDFAVNGTPCTGANRPPTVSLTAPADNSSHPSGSPITLSAAASDPDGTVDRVEFYNGTTLIATDTTAPYSVQWANAPIGQHSLAARAHDNRGASALSTPIAVTVIGAPTIVASPASVTVRQGETARAGIKLATQPSGTVTVAIARSAGSTDLTATPASLTFTPTDWNTEKPVTIASADNGGELATATFRATATGYTAGVIEARELSADASDYTAAFLEQYHKIKDPASGYFRDIGGLLVPYHSVETLLVEAPDHGHQTTSEAYSYYVWLEAAYGRISGDWAPFNKSWESLEKYIIPSAADQPNAGKYNAADPATYAPEHPHPSAYPSQLDGNVPVGQDPIAGELKSAYGQDHIYGMHWLLDVDNTLGFGHCGDESDAAPAYINTYQRGSQESVWETIPQPSCDTFAHGGPNGFLDLFTGDAQYAKQWKYTNAPDADARAVQVAYMAKKWATEQGKGSQVADVVAKATKMGDYLRYAMFDKYFKRIGNCTSPASCPGGTGKSSAHYLMSWYYAWGGATDTSAGWAWRIGDGANHQGYQNPLAAYALANDPAMKPKSATGQQDWATSLTRQLQFIKWLQSADGGIAGGATNSWDGQYGAPPSGLPTFNGMFYDEKPVWHDPPSNRWFGFQVWGMERVAALYSETGNAQAKDILDKWVPWAIANTDVGTGGDFAVPSDMTWTGRPAASFTSSGTNWPAANPNLRVTVDTQGQDVGVAAALAKTLLHYAARSGNAAARTTGEGLLDALLANQDALGITTEETRRDYSRFDDEYTAGGDGVYVPPGWRGTMPNGDVVEPGATFLSIRSFYTQDPDWPEVQAYLDGGPPPTFTYHRFWAQAEIATAFAAHVDLFTP